jgi:cell division protein FtsW
MPDRRLFVLASLLIIVGIVMSYSLTAYTVVLFEYQPYHFVLRQLLFGIVAISIMWGLSYLDPDKWIHKIGFSLFFGGFFVMILMPLLPETIVTEVGGAKRWIKIFGFSVAPVEFFKVGFVYFLSWSFSRRYEKSTTHLSIIEQYKMAIPYAVIFFVAVLLITVVQNDLGQVVILGLTFVFLLLFAGSSFTFFLSILGMALSVFTIFILIADHRILRIKMWWATAQNFVLTIFPESIASKLRVASTEEAYQIGHSLNAIHNGGFFGVGLGNGTFKLGFLSEVHTDFVLAGITEEFGFFGVMIIVFSMLYLLQRIFKIAGRSKNASFYLFSLGVGLLLSFAFLINAYGISSLAPIKGISVPFISYGGSAIIATSIAVGMVLMISKKVNMKQAYEELK